MGARDWPRPCTRRKEHDTPCLIPHRKGTPSLPNRNLHLSDEYFVCAPEKRPCTPKDTILTPGFGFSITPVPKFPDRPGRENRVHFSYAFVFYLKNVVAWVSG